VEFQPAEGIAQLRLLVRDEQSGELGSIDMPYSPESASAQTDATKTPDRSNPVVPPVSPAGNEPSTQFTQAAASIGMEFQGQDQDSEIASYCEAISSSVEQVSALERVCEFALSLPRRLPDVICDREMTRHWWEGQYAKRDVVTSKVSYRGGQEYYGDIKIDGMTVDPASPLLSGSWSMGEFATILQGIFSPLSDAEFTFKLGEALHSIPAVCCFCVPCGTAE
jgi:hypothetical protein